MMNVGGRRQAKREWETVAAYLTLIFVGESAGLQIYTHASDMLLMGKPLIIIQVW